MDVPVKRRRIGVIPGFMFLLAASVAGAGIGRTPGFASVSPEGEAQYTIPIDLPPGTHGMTPELSLQYRHRTRGSLLGVGWFIGGLSEITRCVRTVAQDGVAAAPQRTIADRFCLDGQRLVIANHVVYETPNAEYRTEIESFARIRAIPGTSKNGPAYFTVEAADGRIYEYGATPDSRIDGTPGPSTNGARVWALSRIRDRAGNVIDYRYTGESGSTAYRIASIQYNANPAAGVTASHQVSFIYEERPDSEIDAGYVAGMPAHQVMRLDRIDVLYKGSVLRRFDLEYEPALSSGGRRRLASIQECGAGGSDCFPATTFQWQEGTPGVSAPSQYAMQIPGPAAILAGQSWTFADINGDGRSDPLWVGGTDIATATIHYRLSLAGGGLGPAINSGIRCPRGLGVPFDANGDGRADILMISPAATWSIARGGPSGLGAAFDTGIAVPTGTRDFRGADLNGDGLGDIAWSEAPDPQVNSLRVRARHAVPGGGFSAPATLYAQSVALGYQNSEGGDFIGWPGVRIDLDADGAEELLMNENYSIARIGEAGFGTDRFDSTFAGVTPLDFNDDDCTDVAYKHMSGFLRVRLSKCTVQGSTAELQGPAWIGSAELLAHDWNGDGREDLLLRGTGDWMVVVSRGESFAPIADTGVAHENLAAIAGRDIDGDGLKDLAQRTANQLRLRFGTGPVPDLLISATDGFGVGAEFAYDILTDPAVYTPGGDAVYPEQVQQMADSVVSRLTMTDGSGKGHKASTDFRYEGLRRDVLGRGSLGFRKMIRTELTAEHPLRTEITRRQDYPYTGLPESVIVRQASGKTISATEYQWSKLDIDTLMKARRYPYPARTTTRRFAVGGPFDGSEIVRTVRDVAAIDSVSGLVTDETMTTTEIGGGINAGSSASLRTQHTGVFNDTANWCLGRSWAVQLTASNTLPGGAAITRTADQNWDGLKCRPTRIRLLPGDRKWQVTHNLTYDAFGNISREKVTGIGMAPRSVALNWGPRGQLPIRVTNPLSQVTRYTWDEGGGMPLTFKDSNNSMTHWSYDAFGRLQRESQPDGTSTEWTREGCKAACDDRAKYRLRQEDLDIAGIARVTAWLEVDQHDRGFRLESEEPGGGRSVATVDSGERGQVTRHYLPHWDGSTPPGYLQFNYDALGRLSGEQLATADGSIVRSLALEYDGLSVTQTDPLGHVTTGARSAWGPLMEVVDAKGGRTRYEYDAFGALLRVRDAQDNTVATLGYNPRGMKVSIDDMDRGAWNWTRNAMGETTALRDAKGQVIQFEYDLLGRVTKRTAPDGTAYWVWGSVAGKHEIGRLASLAGPGYSENFTYDGIGRPATHTVVADARYRYAFTYNTQGLLDTMTFPAAGAGSAFRIGHVYDAGRLSRIVDAAPPGEPYWTLNARDAGGHALDVSLGSSVRVVSGYSPVGAELEYRQAGVGGGTAIQDLEYDWDAGGNLTRRRDLNHQLLEEFQYDSLDRLASSRRNGTANLELDYDPIGNIRRNSDVCSGTAPCYAYHATRKHAVVSAGSQSFSYDANGNMTSRDGAAIAWTSDNLPLSIARSNGSSSQFWYGPAGNRWMQVARQDASTETTIYAGSLFEKVTRGGVTTWRHYLPLPGGVALHLRYSDGTPATMRYLALDHLGSTDKIFDASGNVLVTESFSPWGSRRRPTWTGIPTASELAKIATITRVGFAGHEQLDNLDLIHMNGRVYDPQLGRFISADPFVTLPYDGQGLNRYAYVLNNPLAFTDPSGFDPVPCLATQSGNCVQITVIGISWADYMRAFGGAHSAEVASALERDPCGQNGSALACAMLSGTLASPSSIVLTVGRQSDEALSTSGRLDAVQGFAARIANLTIGSSPIAMLFGADPDFQYFTEPGNDSGRAGAQFGNVGYFIGGAAGVIRKGGAELGARAPSVIARSMQGTAKYPGIDRFKDITLKKGTLLYAGFPGQGSFYTTAGAMRRAGASASQLFGGLQIASHESKSPRTRAAAYEVMEDTQAAFALALANPKYGDGWLPQVIVPSYKTTLRFLTDFPLGP